MDPKKKNSRSRYDRDTQKEIGHDWEQRSTNCARFLGNLIRRARSCEQAKVIDIFTRKPLNSALRGAH